MIAVLNNQSLPKKKSFSRFRLRPRRLLTIESLKVFVIFASIAMMVLYLVTSSLTLSLLLVKREAAPSAGPPATMMIAGAQKPEWTGISPKALPAKDHLQEITTGTADGFETGAMRAEARHVSQPPSQRAVSVRPEAGRYGENRTLFEDLADTSGIPSFSLYAEEVSLLSASNGGGPLE